MNKIKTIIFLWLPVFLWAGLIFYLSSVQNLKTTSAPYWDEIFRNGAHFAFYGIFYLLFFRALNFAKKEKDFLTPLILSGLYALSDEIHQSFVPTRSFQLLDLTLDLFGIILGPLFIKRFKKIEKIL